MSFFDHLYCADCGSDNIVGNGDNHICADCGSFNHEEYDEDTDTDIEPVKPINASQYLNDMFGSWVPIFGGKQ